MPILLLAAMTLAAAPPSSVVDTSSIELWQTGKQARPVAVVYVSGDMGLRLGLGGKIVPRLTSRGYAVATINSASAFRDTLSPAQTALLLGTAARRAMAAAGATRFAIVGHSFGADIAPPAIALLPPGLSSRLALVALIVPSVEAYDHVSLTEIIGAAKPNRHAFADAAALTGMPRLCISGQAEKGSLCPLLAPRGYAWHQLPGGHYLDSQPAPLADLLLSVLDRLPAPKQ